jgi:beta-barrel assembly-enhancing protease
MRSRARLSGGAALAVLLAAGPLAAQTKVNPGFNVFSVQQDVEIGRQSAAQAERQLPVLRDRNAEAYVNRIVADLAPHAPGHKFPYQAKLVNASDINAFALPGGFLYLNRGLIEAARTEGELAGVIAHEMAHIALRHGTHNASKAYATQAGLGVLGGLLGRGQSRNSQQIINLVGGLGLNAVFLKYSRDAETQADVVGAQMLARAGYDPMEMASMFEVLQGKRRGEPGRVSQFFSSHPAPSNRAARIRQEAQLLGAREGTRRASQEFDSVRGSLKGQAPARRLGDVAQRPATVRRTSNTPARGVRVDQPSSRYSSFRQRNGYFTIEHPQNWQPHEADNGFGVTIVPQGGVVDQGDGQESIVYGVIVNHYDPFEGGAATRGATLDGATNDIVNQVRQTNPHLRLLSRAPRREVMDGAEARSVVLAGRSPVTGQEERVTVFTRQLGDEHVIYSVFVAPAQDYSALSPTFARMMESLRVDDRAAHQLD